MEIPSEHRGPGGSIKEFVGHKWQQRIEFGTSARRIGRKPESTVLDPHNSNIS
jgi:hypothetical protein